MLTTVPKKLWRRYFKFSYVRNPWKRAISEYLWQRGHKDIRVAFDDFESFLAAALDRRTFQNADARHLLPQKDFVVFDTNGLLVDFLRCIENFGTDMETVCERTGIFFQNFPHINNSDAPKSIHEFYKPETRKLIERL